jgi:hypothetical protein
MRLMALFIAFFVASLAIAGPWTDRNAPDLPADFASQGEYVGSINGAGALGAQVIALSKGEFHAVLYPGGLPGAGWDGMNKILMSGTAGVDGVSFVPAGGNRHYNGKSGAEFAATKTFPPVGHRPYSGSIVGDTFIGKTDDGKGFSLKKVERKSPTLGAKPPAGAIVLFDGSNKDAWQGGRLDETSRLLNTDGRDIRSKQAFNDYSMHLEFMLPYRPEARGQKRGNSGFYQIDHYEVQVLDSFGLEGEHNECGGIYSKKRSDVNMCFPPLSWQTYDVDFTNAKVDAEGKKTANARITVRLNGVVIHDDYELPGKTGGSRGDPEGTPGPMKLQGHGNPLQYRNIWIVEK